MLASIAVRFLYPPAKSPNRLLISPEKEFELGSSQTFQLPSGAEVVIARQSRTGQASDFIALSSTCPHLGCRVAWEPQNDRFFCPCHNGVFNPRGQPVSGPPAQSNQSLSEYPLRIEKGLLFIEAPPDELRLEAEGSCSAPHRPGHDPCLTGRRSKA